MIICKLSASFHVELPVKPALLPKIQLDVSFSSFLYLFLDASSSHLELNTKLLFLLLMVLE